MAVSVHMATNSAGALTEEALNYFMRSMCKARAHADAMPADLRTCELHGLGGIPRAELTFDTHQAPNSQCLIPMTFVHPTARPTNDSPVVPRCLLTAQRTWDSGAIAALSRGAGGQHSQWLDLSSAPAWSRSTLRHP